MNIQPNCQFWRLIDLGEKSFLRTNRRYEIIQPSGLIARTVCIFEGDGKLTLKRARLICAAPEMYDALWAVQQLLVSDATHCHKIISDALAKAQKIS